MGERVDRNNTNASAATRLPAMDIGKALLARGQDCVEGDAHRYSGPSDWRLRRKSVRYLTASR